MIGVSDLPVLVKLNTHSTAGKSVCSIISQATDSPVAGLVRVTVCTTRPASSLRVRSSVQPGSSSAAVLSP